MPTSTASPTVLRWYFALELGRLRQRSGLTLRQVADRLGCSTGHVGHLEAARSLPSQAELEVLLDFYQARDLIPCYVQLLRAARRGKDWWLPYKDAAPSWFELFLGLESMAAQIESYDAQVVSGLFQTPAYTEAIIRAQEPELPETEIARRIELRQARQRLLTRESDPVSVWSITDEAVLLGTAGKPAVMREQLEHLLKLSERPNVTILVLPLSTRPHAGSTGTFRLLSFSELPGAPAIAYTDGMTQGSYHVDPVTVLGARNTLMRLHNLAESPAESRARIYRRIEELE